MSLTIRWDFPALAIFYDLRVHEATAIDRAVQRFAATQQGRVERIGPHYRLHVGVMRVRFAIDRKEGAMDVLYIYRVS